jgi:hypothetical protein
MYAHIFLVFVEPWDSHALISPEMNSEIVVHGLHSECSNSTSAETIINSDIEFKPVLIFLI